MANRTLTIPLSQILVRDRQRQDYGDLQGLAASLKKRGQLQNILVETPTAEGLYPLIAGGRRLAGLAAAGITEADVKVYNSDMDDLLRQELELEENIQRKELDWKEREGAIANIHRIKSAMAAKEGKEWRIEDTADLVGSSTRKVYAAIELTKALATNPEIAKADTAHGAMQRLTQIKDLEKRKTDVKVRQLAEGLGTAQRRAIRCVQGDALARMKEVPDESQDFVITNPPFGVDIQEVFTSDHEIYEDDYDVISKLCQGVWREAYRVLKPDRWFVCFYPTLYLQDCRQFLTEAGFKFQKVPAVWIKPNKRVGNVGDGTQALVIAYENFFFARKGNARFHDKAPTNNVFTFDTEGHDRIHKLQMPPALWDEIFRLITLRGERGVEPFSGSGSAGVAAIGRDLDYTGFELDQEYVDRANMWIGEAQDGKEHASGLSINLTDEKIPF